MFYVCAAKVIIIFLCGKLFTLFFCEQNPKNFVNFVTKYDFDLRFHNGNIFLVGLRNNYPAKTKFFRLSNPLFYAIDRADFAR